MSSQPTALTSIAEFLEGHPGVRALPGAVDGDADAAGQVCERTEVFTLTVSLGSEDCDELIADLDRALAG
ncbi:hypothetical protein [Streptomyces dysideae]|uniref:Uncharacterized protein n=1 Tax=Streptomyces dysideae TaxID=909626 RepID=A0A101UZ70_9ACTN|nr:hypothetical protein [Streptomyces dysideae]KUO19518.1 hypothetical protein AQJ91_19375 [Streptomyces dysideae]